MRVCASVSEYGTRRCTRACVSSMCCMHLCKYKIFPVKRVEHIVQMLPIQRRARAPLSHTALCRVCVCSSSLCVRVLMCAYVCIYIYMCVMRVCMCMCVCVCVCACEGLMFGCGAALLQASAPVLQG